MENSIGRLKRAIGKLKGIKNPKPKKVIVKVTSSVTGIKAIANKIDSHWADVKSSWGKIVSKSKSITLSINATVHDNIDSAVIQLGGINANIQGALDSIQSVYRKTISVYVNTRVVNTKTGEVTVDRNQYRRGGRGQTETTPIYKALGGFARPRGTDTVPAMLTPGEYVVRRKAVDTFGARFFQSLNHLDLRSALNALSIRAGQNTIPKSSTTINNKTINNTNKPNVVVNNYENGGVGLTRATRWAGALGN